MKMGRPTKRNDDVIKRILDGLSVGTPLAVLCREDGMPATRTVRDWAQHDEELAAAIAGAREDGFDILAGEALSIIDEPPEMVVSEGGSRIDAGHVQWAKNRAELRLKLLAKWDPKRYGDKTEVDHKSSDGSMTPREPSYKLVD